MAPENFTENLLSIWKEMLIRWKYFMDYLHRKYVGHKFYVNDIIRYAYIITGKTLFTREHR